MNKLIPVLLMLISVTVASAQTFKECRVGGRAYDATWKQQATEVQCNEDGKPTALAFPIDSFAFGNQCAVTKDELSKRSPGVTYGNPFTLRYVSGKWEMEQEPYSVCEAWLNELPICYDRHGKKEPGKIWKQEDLWHLAVPCQP